MLDPQIVLDILRRHLGDRIPSDTLETIADEIVQALAAQWEEVPVVDEEMGYAASLALVDVCLIDRLLNEGYELRVFRSKKPVRPKGYVERCYMTLLTGRK